MATARKPATAPAVDTTQTDPWDELIANAETEVASTAHVEVPQKIADLVDKVYQNGLRATLPVRDSAHHAEVKAVLVAAAKQHEPQLSVIVTQVMKDNQVLLRFTAGAKRGRKTNGSK